jgi:glycosyltransferase involved in cell wall biosynthesis
VRKVLFVIPQLTYSGTARQAMLAASALPRDRFETLFVVLGDPTPWCEELRATGVQVKCLGRQRPLDVQFFLLLRSLARDFQPDVVHAWGLAALLAAMLTPGVRAGGQVVTSGLLPAAGRPGWIDRFLLRRAIEVIALGTGEHQRYLECGVPAERLHRVQPAVAGGAASKPAELPISPGELVLLLVGPLTREKGCHEAVWALDILRKVHPHLHLVVVGSGAEQARVEEFARQIHVAPWVHFLGEVPDVGPILARADIVWAPTLADCGRCAVLEAMAAGRPVVASRWPGLEGIVQEDVTGFLVRRGDKAALARQTCRVVEDAELRRRLGEAGRRLAVEEFSLEALVRDVALVYEGRA